MQFTYLLLIFINFKPSTPASTLHVVSFNINAIFAYDLRIIVIVHLVI